ncbi:MAG: phosphoribosyltransferase [Mycobacteriales bacterium]
MGDGERFADRREAGERLAGLLEGYRGRAGLVVLGLPRGGVPVAAVIAERLDAPLDALVVRKLGLPWHPELAMGALAAGGVRVLNDAVIRAYRVDEGELGEVTVREGAEVERQEATFRPGRPRLDLAGRTAIVVDDGLATGATARAAIEAARALGAERVVLAAPVGDPEVADGFKALVDDVVVAMTPPGFGAVGAYYADFSPVSDAEVVEVLAGSAP